MADNENQDVAGTEEAAEKPAPEAPKFVANGKERFRTIPLEWPVEYDGKVYDSITVRRMSARDVAEFMRVIQQVGSAARLPVFDAPHEVIDALDADDADRVNEAVNDFLPRSLKPEDAQTPAS